MVSGEITRASRSILSVCVFLTLYLGSVAYAAISIHPDRSKLEPGYYHNADGSPIVELIDSAKKRLDIEIYEMDDPSVLSAIRKALARGVKVQIVREATPVGGGCKVFERETEEVPLSLSLNLPTNDSEEDRKPATCPDQQKLVREVTKAGGKYVPFVKEQLCTGTGNCLEHGKLAIADSKVALISTGNFNTTNLCDLKYAPSTCNRDYSILTDEPDAVRTLQNVIDKDIRGLAYDAMKVMVGTAKDTLTIGPNSLAPLVSFIKSAKRRIQVQNQYLKDPTLNSALIDAASRGVAIQLNVASACSFAKPTPSQAKAFGAIYQAFEDVGIESRMFNKNITINGKKGYLHAKAIVVDDSRAWVGSVNGSTQAATKNREFGIFFDTAADVEALALQMTEDFDHEHSLTWQDSVECAEFD